MVAAVAVVIALALIAGLHSELNSVMKNHELSLSNFQQKLDSFSCNTSDLLVCISPSILEVLPIGGNKEMSLFYEPAKNKHDSTQQYL